MLAISSCQDFSVLPLLLLLGGLALAQYHSEQTALLMALGRDGADLAAAVDGLVRIADDHVKQLRQVAEDQLARHLPAPLSPLREHLVRGVWTADDTKSERLTLDALAGSPLAALVGNFQGSPAILSARHGDLV